MEVTTTQRAAATPSRATRIGPKEIPTPSEEISTTCMESAMRLKARVIQWKDRATTLKDLAIM